MAAPRASRDFCKIFAIKSLAYAAGDAVPLLMHCPKCQAYQPDGSPRCRSCGLSLLNASPIEVPQKQNGRPALAIAAAVVVVGLIVVVLNLGSGKAKTPEDAIMLPVKAIRSNDLKAFFATMPDVDRDDAKQKWE